MNWSRLLFWRKKAKPGEQPKPKPRPRVRFTGNVAAKGDFFLEGDIAFLVGGDFDVAGFITVAGNASLEVTGTTNVGWKRPPPYTVFKYKTGEYVGINPPVEQTVYIRDWLDEIIYEHPGPFAIEKKQEITGEAKISDSLTNSGGPNASAA
jgi:hypothetical protein